MKKEKKNNEIIMILREIVGSILEGVNETKETDKIEELQQGVLIGYYDSLLSIKEEIEANGIDPKDVLLDFDLDELIND
ncbi:MAG: hypothetical protein IKH65_07455 [Clostridia bacterium]|nr:hypothetical protein [Clostridia bacterium]